MLLSDFERTINLLFFFCDLKFNICIFSHWQTGLNYTSCLLYTSDAADDMQCVDLGGRRIIKKIFFKQKTAYEM